MFVEYSNRDDIANAKKRMKQNIKRLASIYYYSVKYAKQSVFTQSF